MEMITKKQQLQRIVREYQQNEQEWPASAADIARWAVSTGRYDLTRPTLVRHCARELAQAMRQEFFTDSKGRRVRAKHPAKMRRDGRQLMLWDDIRTAPRRHMQMAFQLRRRRIASECKQVKTDVDSYNDAHPNEQPIQMVLDFTRDVEEMELAEDTYSRINEFIRKPIQSHDAVLEKGWRKN
jgi:hypothetical protein